MMIWGCPINGGGGLRGTRFFQARVLTPVLGGPFGTKRIKNITNKSFGVARGPCMYMHGVYLARDAEIYPCMYMHGVYLGHGAYITRRSERSADSGV